MQANFPTADRNRLICNAADQLLKEQAPSSWHFESLTEADFGFDMLVQVAHDGGVQYTFYLQLKGTESPNYVKENTALSFTLKRRTLNLYANQVQDTLLVVVVVALDERNKLDRDRSCAHWQWMSQALQEKRGSAYALDQGNTEASTVHIPLHQAISPELDVQPHLQRQLEVARAADGLQAILEREMKGTDSGTVAIARLFEAMRTNPAQFALLMQGSEVDVPAVSSQIQEVKVLLRTGQTEQADARLMEAGPTGLGDTPALRAAWLSLRAKVELQRWSRTESLALFERAYGEDPTEDLLVSASEVRFLIAVDNEDTDGINAVCFALQDVRSTEGLTLLVRAHVALRQHDAAQTCLDRMEPKDRVMAELILRSGQKRWDDVAAVAGAAIQAGYLELHQLAGVQLVAARAAWFHATASTSLPADQEETPLFGAVGTDVVLAQEAWRWTTDALVSLKSLGWPPNVALIAPVLCACAGALGRHQEALALLKPAAERRPEYLELQHNLELLAIGCDDIETALSANQRQGSDHAALVRRVTLLHPVKRFAECVDAALAIARSSEPMTRQTPMALALGHAAACRVGRVLDARKLQQRLETKPEWAEYLHFARFAELGHLGRSDPRPLQALRDGLAQCPKSTLLMTNLFSNLDVRQEAHAREVAELSKQLRRYAMLSLRESVHVLSAHLTLKQWSDAAECSEEAIARFGPSDRLLSMAAVAYEMLGQTAKALDLLEQAVQSGTDRISAVHNFMSIGLRLGRASQVRSAINRLLELVSDRTERLELLRLSALLHSQEGNLQHAQAAAEQFGSQVDTTVEQEEGTYLSLTMAISLAAPELSPNWRLEFQRRVDAFATSWPNSKFFRRIDTPIGGFQSLEDLDRIFEPIVGDAKARRQAYLRDERLAQRGELPMPFVLRPRNVLHYVGSAFDLWHIAKRSTSDQSQLHLNSIRLDPEPRSPDLRRDVPLLDLTTLLILDSLDLFDQLFKVFRRVAISRLTVAYVSQNAHELLVGGPGTATAKSILALVNRWLDRIEQPVSDEAPRGGVVSAEDVVRDYAHLASRRAWLIYCDDQVVRAWLMLDHEGLMTCVTTDVLEALEADKHISPFDVAKHLAQLASWNVGIVIGHRYTIASLHGALPVPSSSTVSKRMDAFQQHQPFATLSRAIWMPAKSPKDLAVQMGQLLRSMLHPRSDDDSIAAVLAIWFLRVRLMHPAVGNEFNLACLVVLYAAAQSTRSMGTRLIGILRRAVTAIQGDAMTVAVELQVVRELGSMVADLSHRHADLAVPMLNCLSDAMPERTQEGDAWWRSYEQRRAELHKPAA